MVKEAEREAKEEELSLKKMKRRLDNLDQRLDNIDSMVTAIAERTTVADAVSMLRESYFARIPVFSESIDSVLGVVLAK